MSLTDSFVSSASFNANAASKMCPVLNECNSLKEGIALGDSNMASVNFALLTSFALVGGMGGNAAKI